MLYGANPLEDIINYNVIVRNLTEWTAGNPSLCVDQGTITDGIGNNSIGFGANSQAGFLATRPNLIQGCAWGKDTSAGVDFDVGRGLAGYGGVNPSNVLSTAPFDWVDAANAPSTVPAVIVTRRYQVQFALGLMTQEKLIPTKYMASQLAIEITLETAANCIVADLDPASTGVAGYVNGWQSKITYAVSNVNLIPEILEFDASYDTAFLQGLQNGGVPLKFASWFLIVLTLGIHFSFHQLLQQVLIY